MNELVDTVRSCCNELLACSPRTLRSLAVTELEQQHIACMGSNEPCDACNARLLLVRMLHAVAQSAEDGSPLIEPVKCSSCSNDADGLHRIDGRRVCLQCWERSRRDARKD